MFYPRNAFAGVRRLDGQGLYTVLDMAFYAVQYRGSWITVFFERKAEWKPVITAEEVVAKRFQPTKVRVGYDQDEVDQFLDRAVQELQRLQAENEGLQRQQLDPLSLPVFMTDSLLTPDQVIQQRFQETKIRAGYTQDEVDDFLDKIVHGLRNWTARNEENRDRISGNNR